MNAPFTDMPEFNIGKPVRRSEDPALVQGKGRYSDDIALAGQAFGAVVRSRYAHGRIRAIDTAAAKAMPGVLGVYTAADLAAYHPQKSPFPLKGIDGTPMRGNGTMFMARDKVRFVGDPIALVVAENESLAREAAEAVDVDIDPLPAVVEPRAACAPGAPLVYDDVPENTVVDHALGDKEKVAEAFARAKHVAKLNLINNRLVVAAMEPRAALFEYDPATGRFTTHMQTQGVFGMRNNLAAAMGVEKDKMHVLTGQVGGSFGMKGSVFPEYIALLHATRELKRPIKWSEQRTESFVSDHQGRDHDIDADALPDSLVVSAAGWRIGLVHGSWSRRWDAATVARTVATGDRTWQPRLEMELRQRLGAVDAVIYGHWHVPRIARAGCTLMVCPGAVCPGGALGPGDPLPRSAHAPIDMAVRRFRGRTHPDQDRPAIAMLDVGSSGLRARHIFDPTTGTG